MAKTKKKVVSDEPVIDVELDSNIDNPVVEPIEQVTKESKRALLDAYHDAKARVDAAEFELKTAESDVSAAIGQIKRKLGAGPFVIDGRTVTIMRRESKKYFDENGDGLVSYYFKSIGTEVQEL